MEQTYYLIKKEELTELNSSKSSDAKMKITIEVLSRPYKEKSAGEAILGGIGKGFNAALDKIEEATRPPEKKGGKKS